MPANRRAADSAFRTPNSALVNCPGCRLPLHPIVTNKEAAAALRISGHLLSRRKRATRLPRSGRRTMARADACRLCDSSRLLRR